MMLDFRRLAVACLAASALAHPAAAACTANPTLQAASAMPPLTGRLAFDSRNVGNDQSSLYLYDFKAKTLQQPSAAWQGITKARNPDFSPDGQWITFAGVQNNQWQVFVWKPGQATPTNLTPNTAVRSEDPKFTIPPNSIVLGQQSIIFKQDGNIRRMILGLSAKGTLSVQSVQDITTGGAVDGSYREASAPFLSEDGDTAYYFRGTDSSTAYPSFIYSMSIQTKHEQQLVHPGLTTEYYPIVNYQSPTSSPMVLDVGHTAKQGANDQIYVRLGTDLPVQLSLNACNADNSDPAPVSASLIVFSSDRVGGRYLLYLGNVNTGQVWSLAGVNGVSNALQGSSYSP